MRQKAKIIPRLSVVAASMLLIASVPRSASAVPIANVHTESNVDYVSGGISGIGGGSGSITISGVTGTVTKAFLYWHGIDNSGSGAVYDNANITLDGNPVVGTAIGDATTNCWGSGSSRGFRADVTSLVSGDGVYALAGLSSGTGHSANGASLVVIFDDGNPGNNRDLVFFEGNDSNIPDGFPGEDDGWHATLSGINYAGGSVSVQMHAADGQAANEDALVFTSGAGNVTITDTALLWEGVSLPNAGTSRSAFGGLWDIHTFDVTAAFGPPGPQTLSMDGMAEANSSDCIALVLLLMDLEPGSAPPTPTATPTPSDEPTPTQTDETPATPTATPTSACGDGVVDAGESCDPPNSVVSQCGQTCRADCTHCGDGVVQASAGETCDDGNCAECDPLRPQRPLDGCNNSCAGNICRDPSRIKLMDGLDVLHFHGRLAPLDDARGITLAGNDVTIGLRIGEDSIFEAMLRPEGTAAQQRRRFRYKNPAARQEGGIYKLFVRQTGRTYTVTATVYGDLSAAAPDMIAEVTVGGKRWSVHGTWQPTPTGYVFKQ